MQISQHHWPIIALWRDVVVEVVCEHRVTNNSINSSNTNDTNGFCCLDSVVKGGGVVLLSDDACSAVVDDAE